MTNSAPSMYFGAEGDKARRLLHSSSYLVCTRCLATKVCRIVCQQGAQWGPNCKSFLSPPGHSILVQHIGLFGPEGRGNGRLLRWADLENPMVRSGLSNRWKNCWVACICGFKANFSSLSVQGETTTTHDRPIRNGASHSGELQTGNSFASCLLCDHGAATRSILLLAGRGASLSRIPKPHDSAIISGSCFQSSCSPHSLAVELVRASSGRPFQHHLVDQRRRC